MSNGMTRRQFIANVAVATAGVALLGGNGLAQEGQPKAPAEPAKPGKQKPRFRFTLDPFEVQKEGLVVYSYGTHEKSTEQYGVDIWYGLKGHNFAGCRGYPLKDKKTVDREEVRKYWEKQNVVPVYMSGADPKNNTQNIRKAWENAVTLKYPVLSIDEFYPAPRTPVAFDEELKKFKKDHPEIFVQAWEANFAKDPVSKDPFPHLELLSPFIDQFMPEVYWKWFKKDDERRKIFRSLIDRAKKIGALNKLVMGLGTHDVPHIEKTLEDIPVILDMEPNIGGFAFFIHQGGSGEEYDKLHAKLDDLLRGLFAA